MERTFKTILMIHTILPYNPVIIYMKYSNEVITIGFKKANYERSYNINQELAYRFVLAKKRSYTTKVDTKQYC